MLINKAAVNRARLHQGLFLSEVAKEAGVSASAVEMAFRTGRCGLKVARSIAKALGLRLADILVDEDASQQPPAAGHDCTGSLAVPA